ncbi:SMAL1 [Enterospora canceri]|uniref:SMAL1 n=1 Tax=Enterospora canceri TaxID=1081671 RepID=A0A1Y1S4J6_9MICR|nr:SMAL1 [Enterospora canceri]
MGLGKTIQALAIAKYYDSDWPLLVICPAGLLHDWREAIGLFLDASSTIVRDSVDFGDKISIISNVMATKYSDMITADNYKVIIVDECHGLKSTKTQRTKALLPILQKSTRLIMCSGTPAVSRPVELYPIIQALHKGPFTSYNEYGMRYCNGRLVNGRYDFQGCSNADELSYFMEKEFMIRRRKEAVLSKLPKKNRKKIELSLENVELTEGMVDNKTVIGNDVALAYRKACEVKVDPVLAYINSLVEKETKFLVFAHHKTMIDAIAENIKSMNIKYMKIDGNVPVAKRKMLVDAFQKDDSYKVAVLSLTAASTGLTLTAASLVVFAELFWNPGVLMQAEDRAHRIGQTKPVEVLYLVCEKTIDEIVWPYLLRKLSVLEKIGLSKNELKQIKGQTTGQKAIDEYFNMK